MSHPRKCAFPRCGEMATVRHEGSLLEYCVDHGEQVLVNREALARGERELSERRKDETGDELIPGMYQVPTPRSSGASAK